MKAVEYKETLSQELAQELRSQEHHLMEELLLYEIQEWEQLFWNKFKAFLDQNDNDWVSVELKQRLTREWKANCWKRLNPQMERVYKRLADVDIRFLFLRASWESTIGKVFGGFEGVGSSPRDYIDNSEGLITETRLRMEKEIWDIEFRLRRGSELGRFDQFWDDNKLFECRYSRSKWLYLNLDFLKAPLEIYSHALKGNKNIIHIDFAGYKVSDSDVKAIICDLPWVTSISWISSKVPLAIHPDALFIKSANNNLIRFAKDVEPKLDPISTYIFTDAGEGLSIFRDSDKLYTETY